jgi:hypothetical protein
VTLYSLVKVYHCFGEDGEDGNTIFLQNIRKLPPHYIAPHGYGQGFFFLEREVPELTRGERPNIQKAL